MAAVGKKNKKRKVKRVYVERRRRSSSLVPLVLAAGLGFYLLYVKKPAAVDPGTGTDSGTGTGTDTGTGTTNTGGGLTHVSDPRIVDDGSGTGTSVIQPTPITVTPGTNTQTVSQVALVDKQVLARDASQVPGLLVALSKMTSQEILDTYQYFYGYYLPGKELYRYPDPSHPGQFNTALYDAVQVIRSKYNIF